MRVLREGFIEVWFFPDRQEDGPIASCVSGEMQIDIRLDSLQVFKVYEPSHKGFLWGAKRMVERNQEYLLKRWEEENP